MSDATVKDLTLSVIIPNYNYAAYVGAAIRSAVQIRWPSVEVIVVDDGSTDNSLDIIKEFANGIKVVEQANVGQMASCVNGLRASSGGVIIFLDSDDVLHPDVMTEIAAVWSNQASKYQFQMRVIDAAGRPTGNILPQYLLQPRPQQIRQWATTAGAYPTPPGSGNAYPRWFVERVFTFETDFVDRAPDSFLLAAAPALGDVITISKPLADYRVHGQNHGAFLQLDETRFARETGLALRRHNFFTHVAKSVNLEVAPEVLDRSLIYLCLRAASYRLRPDMHPVASDSARRIFADTLGALPNRHGFSIGQSLALFVWLCAVLMVPRAIAKPLVSWRYVPSTRPAWIKRFLVQLKFVR
jgi:glycosyltransferase involved in cell wall biosynthesis